MAKDFYVWSTTFDTNASADSDMPLVEGSTTRASINNTIRAGMGKVARFADDIAGVVTVGGTANAITVTTKVAFTELENGMVVRFPVGSANTGAVTLNANSIGNADVKKIVGGSAVALAAGDLQPGTYPLFIYYSTHTAWILLRDQIVETIIIPCSDMTTALTATTGVGRFCMPWAMTLFAGKLGVKADVGTAPTGSGIIVDINENGSTILSTKLTIDAGGTDSDSAATPAVISDTSLAARSIITIDRDQVGSTIAGADLKVTLIGVR